MNWTDKVLIDSKLKFFKYIDTRKIAGGSWMLDDRIHSTHNFVKLDHSDLTIIFNEIINPNIYNNKISLGVDKSHGVFESIAYYNSCNDIYCFIYEMSMLLNYYELWLIDLFWDKYENKIIYHLWVK